MTLTPIAVIKNDYKEKFTVPRQSCLANSVMSKIIFEKEYASPIAFKGLEGFSHIWLIWEFDKNLHKSTSLTVRPPRLGGNERVGVFATRAPYRPNPIGLSSVKLEGIETDDNGDTFLLVSGADLVDGTKIYDIKPYVKISDCHEDAVCGFSDEMKDYRLNVSFSPALAKRLNKDEMETLTQILEGDPRPAYQNDSNRIYGFRFADKEIKFKVSSNELIVTEIIDE